MGVNTVTRGILALFIIGIIWLGFMPTVNDLANDENLWEDVIDTRALDLRDFAMLVYYVGGLFGFFATLIWTINAAQSKGGYTAYG